MSRKSKLKTALGQLSSDYENRQKRRFRRAEWRSQGGNRAPWEPTLGFQHTKEALDKYYANQKELEPLANEIYKLKQRGLVLWK